MKEIKELEEAKNKIDDLLWAKCLGDTAKIRKQILNLKGAGWKIAIVRDKVAFAKHAGLQQVIWEAE